MNSVGSIVYMIPAFLDDTAKNVIPKYVVDAVKQCQVFYVENERTARRFLKSIWPEMIIDACAWHIIHKSEAEAGKQFLPDIKARKVIGIISEAGCPGIADPGQLLVALAQREGAMVKPLVGPSAILLALMASGMNGQEFRFTGYLPIDGPQRIKTIKELEEESQRRHSTQVFIETPYRNNQLADTLLKICKPDTRLCIAVNITGDKEFIRTLSIKEWQGKMPDINKQPTMFLIYAGR